MAYSAVTVANAFIQTALEGHIPKLTPMKLQKLMFYAQSWHLKLYESPLIDDFFSKWKYGPVIPSLYHEVKHYGDRDISALIKNIFFNEEIKEEECVFAIPTLPHSDTRAYALIEKIIEVYGPLRGTQLSHLTHLPGTAWAETKKMSDVIPNELMKERIK